MGQFGFFDADRQLAAITAKGYPLEMIARVVPFESCRAEIEAAVLRPVSEKKSPAGRKPIDVMVMFRMLVLQSLYNLSEVEYWFLLPQSTDDYKIEIAAFLQGLKETGYVEGQNVVVQYQPAENQPARLPALAVDLVRRGVAVIVPRRHCSGAGASI
jgi:hypothetical protein